MAEDTTIVVQATSSPLRDQISLVKMSAQPWHGNSNDFRWWYVNLDLETKPDVYADVAQVPIRGQSVDCVICIEVLEHLSRPERCVEEIHRLLRDGELVFASVPFFYPMHADPYDFQRFTEDGLRHLFRDFQTIDVYRMDGYPGVLGLMFELGIPGLSENTFTHKALRWGMKWSSRWLIQYDLSRFETEIPAWQRFTTGYFVRAAR